MKFQTTYGDLNNRLLELENIKANSNTLYLLIAGRVESFYKQNDFAIRELREKMSELFDAHVQKNEESEQKEKGKYKVDEKNPNTPIFIDEEQEKKYKEEYSKLMAKQFFLVI